MAGSWGGDVTCWLREDGLAVPLRGNRTDFGIGRFGVSWASSTLRGGGVRRGTRHDAHACVAVMTAGCRLLG